MADSDQPAVPSSTQGRETLGQILRNARIARELTVEQVAAELRIEAKQLTALEENRFEKIGVPVFVKGYLKQYGQRLGVDVRALLALYYQQTTLADVEIQPSRTIKLRDDRQITSWIMAAIVLLTLIVGLAVWWANGGNFDTRFNPGSSTPVTPSASPAATPEPEAAEGAATAPAVPPPEAATESAPAAEPSASRAPDAARASADASDDARIAAAAVVTIPLEFTFDQESWAEVTDARGERLLFGLSAAGRRATVRGEPPFAIVIGNAAAVRLLVDGEPYSIPTAGRQGDLARFSVDIAEE
jgi:cytoskeleton protein RodZ